MKIAYITTGFGALSHTFIRREVAALRKLGLDIELFGVRPDRVKELSEEDKRLTDETVYLYPLNMGKILYANIRFMINRPRNYFKTFKKALFNEEHNIFQHAKLIYHFFVSVAHALEMHKRGISHIHAHFINVASTIAMYAAGLLGTSYSITLHSGGIKNLSSVIGLKEKIKYAKFLCSVSNYNIDYYDQIYPCRNKNFLVHSGIDPDCYTAIFNRNVSQSLQIEREVHLISIGRLVKKKGFTYLIEACRYLREEAFIFKLTMIGDGYLLKGLQDKAAEYKLKDKIVFKGGCSEDAVLRELERSHICIVPSVEAETGEKEGIPVVIMEAMAAGVPVIATKHSGIPEIVKDRYSGILVPENDPLAIAGAIKLLTKDGDLRKKCISTARQVILEEFNIKNIARLKKKIFEENI